MTGGSENGGAIFPQNDGRRGRFSSLRRASHFFLRYWAARMVLPIIRNSLSCFSVNSSGRLSAYFTRIPSNNAAFVRISSCKSSPRLILQMDGSAVSSSRPPSWISVRVLALQSCSFLCLSLYSRAAFSERRRFKCVSSFINFLPIIIVRLIAF